MDFTIEETKLVTIKEEVKEGNQLEAQFIIEPLLPGYGVTLGNALRRVLIGSLPGAAVRSIVIGGVNHEFSTLSGMREDVLELILNIKGLHLKLNNVDRAVLKLSKKGAGEVTAKDFVANPDCEIINSAHRLVHLDKDGKLDLEVTVGSGRGYISADLQKEANQPIETIFVDSSYTPVVKVNFQVEQTRVGGMTNFDRLTILVGTNGAITPQQALKSAAKILTEHFGLLDEAIKIEEKTKEKKESKKKVVVKKTKR
ncbi:MAG: DNA-directed RNA polymerase subunit alpha [Candidatus Berkelbacteria bacterium Licking1014_2]|uniref:DNA-directed RNA polymerase subunit alpha n=1 Tax=Candidatus Berkelbacteria bacterium Licking1014_2 TaxID=2017146 RepID=A0A554LWI8_9BACT|nr:MAG: DNA-directed RNA polymerase subunit alpha [Candidatus Berkelbacteria bacterium Licking1014_2]